MNGRILIRKGGEAAHDLGDPEFIGKWTRLATECPWATVFQSPSFVTAWFETYATQFEPLLVEQYDEDMVLHGFLPLARKLHEAGGLVVAGAHQAEYQAWLSAPPEAGRFFGRALEALRSEFGIAGLTFRYLPDGFPIAQLDGEPLLRGRIDARAVRRPIVDLADPSLVSAQSKQTKNKLNRLRKHGEVRFERIIERDRYDAVLREAIPMYDLRQGAVHNSMPFRQDPLKAAFHRSLFDRGGVLHVTVLFAGAQAVSVQINTCDARAIYLGISAYSPYLAYASPGRIHLVLLLPMIAQEGFRQFDLTPGGDPYKERFASSHDEVHELRVFPARGGRDRIRLQRRLAGIGREAFTRAGLRPSSLKRILRKGGHDFGTISVVPSAEEAGLEYALYGCGDRGTSLHEVPRRLEDGTAELLEVAWRLPPRRRQSVLSEALARLERGESLYVIRSDLGGCCWAWFNPAPLVEGVGWARRALDFPGETGCLYDVGLVSPLDSREKLGELLGTLLAECKALSGARDIYVLLPARSGLWIRAAGDAGLSYHGPLQRPKRSARSPA